MSAQEIAERMIASFVASPRDDRHDGQRLRRMVIGTIEEAEAKGAEEARTLMFARLEAPDGQLCALRKERDEARAELGAIREGEVLRLYEEQTRILAREREIRAELERRHASKLERIRAAFGEEAR